MYWRAAFVLIVLATACAGSPSREAPSQESPPAQQRGVERLPWSAQKAGVRFTLLNVEFPRDNPIWGRPSSGQKWVMVIAQWENMMKIEIRVEPAGLGELACPSGSSGCVTTDQIPQAPQNLQLVTSSGNVYQTDYGCLDLDMFCSFDALGGKDIFGQPVFEGRLEPRASVKMFSLFGIPSGEKPRRLVGSVVGQKTTWRV